MKKKGETGKKVHGVWNDFKTFISKGNVVDMAVGVIMGSAFGAIVTSFTNILLALCTWPVPGGLNGLITILPAISDSQRPADGYKEVLSIEEWLQLETAAEQALYTNYGGTYVYKTIPVLNWGAFINAIISFLIIALVLFIIVKIFNYAKNRTAKLKELQMELYYQKYPEERPKPAEEVPPPEDPQITLLKEIRDELKKTSEPQVAAAVTPEVTPVETPVEENTSAE